MTPERPNGRTAVRIISQRVAPSASAASSCRRGVCRNTSRLTAVMIGRIITASTIATVSITRAVGETLPANSGNQPTFSLSQAQTGWTSGERTSAPHRP